MIAQLYASVILNSNPAAFPFTVIASISQGQAVSEYYLHALLRLGMS